MIMGFLPKHLRPLLLGVCLTAATPAAALVVDLEARAAVIPGSNIEQACTAIPIDLDWDLSPVRGLNTTDEYGSDQSTQEFAWAMMIYSGHALAGNVAAQATLRETLMIWAESAALYETADIHDAHFALKRTLLPLIMAYATVRDTYTANQREIVDGWLDGLVTKIDRQFDGDVDLNNHRYLADSVIAAWGALINDPLRLGLGEDRLRKALLEQLRPDGSWPLEARRGARALWYTRQSLASLTSILGSLSAAGRNPLADRDMQQAYDLAVRYMLDGIRTPTLVLRYAAENYIPGPSDDYATQDLSFLAVRPHGRHYLGFLQLTRQLVSDPVIADRVQALIDKIPADQFPLVDEFSGGNATCFWEPIRG